MKKSHDFTTSASLFRGSIVSSYKRECMYHLLMEQMGALNLNPASEEMFKLHKEACEQLEPVKFDDWVIYESDDEGHDTRELKGAFTRAEAQTHTLFVET